MPAIQTYSDTEFAHLTAQLAKVTAERDRAREIAVALEQDRAAVVEALTSALERTEANFIAAVNGRPVRDMAENLAENRAALDGAA